MAEDSAKTKGKRGFFANLKLEFKKIVWPDKKSAARQTVMVIVVGVIIAVLIALLDTGIEALLGLIA